MSVPRARVEARASIYPAASHLQPSGAISYNLAPPCWVGLVPKWLRSGWRGGILSSVKQRHVRLLQRAPAPLAIPLPRNIKQG